MNRPDSPLRDARNHTAQAAERAVRHPWIERLARFGFAAKGVVYALVGLLAAQTALGSGGATTDPEGVLQKIVTQPFGQILLGLIAIGLLGYTLWRFVQAFLDPEGKGTDAKGLVQRLGFAVNGLVYAGLALSAVQIILGTSRSSSGSGPSDWTRLVLAQPLGQWLVGTAGALIIGIGFYEFFEAYSAKFRQKLKLDEMSRQEKTWITRMGRFGLAARGVVFCLIGFFLIQAARQSDASQARGVGGALQALSQQPYGPWLLGIVAFGLVAYGIYYIAQGHYRQIYR